MREFAKISSHFWINGMGHKMKELNSDAKAIAFYLLTNPHAHMLGIYYLPIAFIAFETGLSMEGTTKGLSDLIAIRFCSYDHESRYVWVHEMAFDQIGSQLKPNDNRVKAVNQLYLSLPDLPFLVDFYKKYSEAFLLTVCRTSLCNPQNLQEAPLEFLRSKEKEKKKEKKKKRYLCRVNQIFILLNKKDLHLKE